MLELIILYLNFFICCLFWHPRVALKGLRFFCSPLLYLTHGLCSTSCSPNHFSYITTIVAPITHPYSHLPTHIIKNKKKDSDMFSWDYGLYIYAFKYLKYCKWLRESLNQNDIGTFFYFTHPEFEAKFAFKYLKYCEWLRESLNQNQNDFGTFFLLHPSGVRSQGLRINNYSVVWGFVNKKKTMWELGFFTHH